MPGKLKPLREHLNWKDPKVRGRTFKLFWLISLFMLVLGYLLIVVFLFLTG